MKAQELNGTHLGQQVTLSLDGANLSDVLREVSHEADLITDTNLSGRERSTLGRQHTRLNFQRFGSVKVAPDTPVQIGAEEPGRKQEPRGAHFLTENPNADPICHCGWDPARELPAAPFTREQARNDIREHVADSKGHRAEGNNFAVTQIRDTSDRNHELNGNDRPGHYGRGISLKWTPMNHPGREETHGTS